MYCPTLVCLTGGCSSPYPRYRYLNTLCVRWYIGAQAIYLEARIGRAQEVVHAQIYCLCPNVLPYTECIEVSVVWAWTGATPG